jgi:hypothetical protein
MIDTRYALAAFALSLTALGTGCSTTSSCIPGRTEECPCRGGSTGTQTCGSDGTFGTCSCGGTDAGTDAGIDATTSTDGGGEDVTATPDTPESADVGSPDAPPDLDAPAEGGTGHLVLIGQYPTMGDDGIDRMIVNSVFLSERTGTLDVLVYTQYAGDPGFHTHPRDVITDAGDVLGRPVVLHDLDNAFDLAATLPTMDVLFVPMQLSIERAGMRAIADGWHDTLVEFLEGGGVVLVMTGATGVSGSAMGAEALVASGEDLFLVPSFTSRPTLTLETVTPAGPVAAGVISPLVPTSGTVCFDGSSGGVVVARSVTELCPVVRHLAF